MSKTSKSQKKDQTLEKSKEVTNQDLLDTTESTEQTETPFDWKEVGQSLVDRLEQCVQKNKESQKEYENEIKELNKELKQFLKKTSKVVRKTKQKGGNTRRSPSGFAKPANISDELADFLGVPTGTQLARTDVTKRLTTYIKEHDLQNPDNKREIFPDAKLSKIIKIPEKYNDQLTYFNFQACFKHHFTPVTNPETVAS